MDREFDRYLRNTLKNTGLGVCCGLFLGLALGRGRFRKTILRYTSLGMGFGAGYTLQNSLERFRNINAQL